MHGPATVRKPSLEAMAAPCVAERNGRAGRLSLLERNWTILYVALTVALDVVVVAAAVVLARRVLAPLGSPGDTLRLLWCAPLVYVASNIAFGMYHHPYVAQRRSQVLRAIKSYGLGSAVLLMIFGSGGSGLSRLVATEVVVILPAAMLAARFGLERARRTLQAGGWAVDPTVLVVDRDEGRESAEWLESLRAIGYDVRAVVSRQLFADPSSLHAEIDRQATEAAARCILVPGAELVENGSAGLLAYGRQGGLKIKVFSPDVQRILARANVHDESGVSIEAPARYKIAWMKRAAKRAFDLVVATLLLVLVSPILVLVAIAVKLESKGPLFFGQLRSLSAESPPFRFCKFRSMYQDAERLKASLQSRNESSGALFKIRRDPRLTRVGKIIRRLSLDELPQLLHVIRGEMSLVGPRPLPIHDYEKMTRSDGMGDYYARRAIVKPGITGLWQISGRSDLDFREMVLLDLYYVDNYTIFVDVEILLNTVFVVLSGRGAY
ncbi:MAG: exopolysaccharide biosynthesis polyprenyl glycosylphosphotransferase [Gemmatimonadetes bacterium]|nr:exopolysaccharide biosynthesis polyprenyl glycosylphosphotransferase [Gemmatimonadota bacterium]